MSITTEVVSITPEWAEKQLGKNHANRKPRKEHINSLARDMVAGNWQPGQTITIDPNGNLLDGQHRLMAIMESGVTVEMIVISGVPPEAQTVIDTGVKRALPDVLQMMGYANTSVLSSAARLSMAAIQSIETGTSAASPNKWTNEEVISFIRNHGDLVDMARSASRLSTRTPFTVSSVGAAWFLFEQARPDQNDDFWYGMSNLDFESVNDPRSRLINRMMMINNQRNRGTIRGVDQLRWLIYTWNLWINGKEIKAFAGPKFSGPLTPVSRGRKGVRGVVGEEES